jgi:hypothetical protein
MRGLRARDYTGRISHTELVELYLGVESSTSILCRKEQDVNLLQRRAENVLDGLGCRCFAQGMVLRMELEE